MKPAPATYLWSFEPPSRVSAALQILFWKAYCCSFFIRPLSSVNISSLDVQNLRALLYGKRQCFESTNHTCGLPGTQGARGWQESSSAAACSAGLPTTISRVLSRALDNDFIFYAFPALSSGYCGEYWGFPQREIWRASGVTIMVPRAMT